MTDAATDLDELTSPHREVRAGRWVLITLGLGLLVSAFIRMDAAAYAQGQVVVSGQRKAVQHREGGVVGEINVREGQQVREGEVLIRLAAADIVAEERGLSLQVTRMLARRARLEAEVNGGTSVQQPAEFARLPDADRETARLAMVQEQAELSARTAELNADAGALSQRAARAGYQGVGARSQTTSAAEQLRLINQELESLRPLAARGFVPQTRLRALERAAAELQGQQGQADALQGQASREASDLRLQRMSAMGAFKARAAQELGDAIRSLGELQPRLQAARDQLARIEIRAPATGTVIGLSAATVGGVITPGQTLMEIVPQAPLRINARVAPGDADDLTTGQEAQIRFMGLHERTLPALNARITRISADSFTDEKTGETYFSAELDVPEDQLAIIRSVREEFELRPGLPAEVVVPLRPRSALSYLVEPLVGAFWSSFREQ